MVFFLKIKSDNYIPWRKKEINERGTGKYKRRGNRQSVKEKCCGN
jgi:hypothetical protein